jgi:ribosomal protein S12 methylthiotransferase
LVECESAEVPGFWEGRSWREAPEIDGVIFLECAEGLHPGSLVNAVITSSEGIDLVAAVRSGK